MTTPQRLVISNFTTGFETNRQPFLLSNDAFPLLENCYIWRGVLQKKRGTDQLGRLARQVVAQNIGPLAAGVSYFSGLTGTPELDPSRIQIYVEATITNVTPAGPNTVISAINGFAPGQTVTISGVAGTGTIPTVNGTFVILSSTGINFTIVLATAGVYASGGVAQVFGVQTQNITGVTNAAPPVVSFAPMATALPNGTNVLISNTTGLDVNGVSVINGNYYAISTSTVGTFELTGEDTSPPVSAYAGGGEWTIFHNYVTGAVQTIFQPPFAGPVNVLANYSYFPDLPVMGIETFENYNTVSVLSNTVFFDTRNSYGFSLPSGTRFFYDTSFYKTTNVPIVWNGTNSQQFWTVNFENAMFATQNVPGLNGVRITSISNANPAVITTTDPHLIPAVGEDDWIFIAGVFDLINPTSSPPNVSFVNGLSLQINVPTTITIPGSSPAVTAVVTATVTGANTIDLVGLNTSAAAPPAPGAGGFMQVLTKQYGPGAPYGTNDGIHWYDGDPTQLPLARFGWVNFAPPINTTDPTNPLDYVRFMTGAKLLTSFGATMMALGTWEISTDPALFGNGPIFNPQRIRWSTIAGTPFYSNPVPTILLSGGAATTEIESDPNAWAENINGRGGYFDLITNERIISVNVQQESLIIGLERTQRRLAATGSVINPFVPYLINPEYGTIATFSTVALDKGVLSVGQYGFIVTTAFNAERFDLKIPDQVFQFLQFVNNLPEGSDRVCSVRNWQEETIHWTYLDVNQGLAFPNRTVCFNYRDPSFAIFKESYTTYGYFSDSLPLTWLTMPYPNWKAWLPNWYAYQELPGYPDTTGGNQQGFVMIKSFSNTTNDFSLKILSVITGADPLINSILEVPKHNIDAGEFIWIDKCVGINGINKMIAKVTEVIDANNIEINIPFSSLTGSYLGAGEIILLDNFMFQTKEFAQMWGQAKGLRLGTQRYLLNKTDAGEFSTALFISQNPNQLVNLREPGAETWLPSTNIVRTRPDESLGIRGSANNQSAIWHRYSVSALGDGVQMGGYMSDDQMQKVGFNSDMEPFPSVAFEDFVLQALVIDVYGSRTLI